MKLTSYFWSRKSLILCTASFFGCDVKPMKMISRQGQSWSSSWKSVTSLLATGLTFHCQNHLLIHPWFWRLFFLNFCVNMHTLLWKCKSFQSDSKLIWYQILHYSIMYNIHSCNLLVFSFSVKPALVAGLFFLPTWFKKSCSSMYSSCFSYLDAYIFTSSKYGWSILYL